MIRRARRSLAALSALWFAILMVAGPLVHVCAMHDGTGGTPAPVASGSHAGHGGAHEQAPSDSECEHCTCLGDCAGATLPTFTGAADRVAELPAAHVNIAAVAALAPAIGSPAVQLPFSVGPPLLA